MHSGLGRTLGALWALGIIIGWGHVAQAQIVEPNGVAVPGPSSDDSETSRQDFFDSVGEDLDAVADAYFERGLWLPVETLEVSLVLSESGATGGLAWYNPRAAPGQRATAAATGQGAIAPPTREKPALGATRQAVLTGAAAANRRPHRMRRAAAGARALGPRRALSAGALWRGSPCYCFGGGVRWSKRQLPRKPYPSAWACAPSTRQASPNSWAK